MSYWFSCATEICDKGTHSPVPTHIQIHNFSDGHEIQPTTLTLGMPVSPCDTELSCQLVWVYLSRLYSLCFSISSGIVQGRELSLPTDPGLNLGWFAGSISHWCPSQHLRWHTRTSLSSCSSLPIDENNHRGRNHSMTSKKSWSAIFEVQFSKTNCFSIFMHGK